MKFAALAGEPLPQYGTAGFGETDLAIQRWLNEMDHEGKPESLDEAVALYKAYILDRDEWERRYYAVLENPSRTVEDILLAEDRFQREGRAFLKELTHLETSVLIKYLLEEIHPF